MKTSLSGSFKGKSVIDIKTKITQTQKKDVCSFEDQVKHFASIALDRDAEVRNRPSDSKRGQLSVEKSLDWDSAFFTNEGKFDFCVFLHILFLLHKQCLKYDHNAKSQQH